MLPRYRMARCWDAGLDGRTVLDRICSGAAARLASGGSLLLVHSGACDTSKTITRLTEAGLVADVVDRARVPLGPVMRARRVMHEERGLVEPDARSEELVVIRARRTG